MSRLRRLHVDPPLPFDEAARLVREAARPLEAEWIGLAEAHGRILADAVMAPHAVPPFENSTVDGFAVRAADVAGASASAPVELSVRGAIMAGGPPVDVETGTAVRIMTGGPVPPGADAVVMLEWTSFDDGRVFVEKAPAAGQFVRRVGEDMQQGAPVLETGARLGPAELGVLASLGIARLRAYRRPRVAVLATGDELLDVTDELRPGMIRSSNSWTLAGQAREAGAVVQDLGRARDEDEELAGRLDAAERPDVLVTSGGVSVGDRDRVQDVLRARGLETVFWRVRSSPGKPLLFGRIGPLLVFGVPGNPVSSMVAFENFVRPTLLRLQGDPAPSRPRVHAVLESRVSGPEDRRHFARVRVSWERDRFVAHEVRPHGSGNLRSMANANALAILPEGRAAAEAGETLEVLLLGPPDPGSAQK